MSNQPSPYKKILSVQVRRETIKKLDTMSSQTGLSRNSLISAILDESTQKIQLTDKQKEELKNEIEQFKSKH